MTHSIKFILIVLITGLFVVIQSNNVLFNPKLIISHSTKSNYYVSSIESYKDQEPIVINKKSGFETYSSRGDGSVDNPYYLENFRISNSSTPCINITGVEDTYFVIQNCLFLGNNSVGTGIYIDSIQTGSSTLYNNTFLNLYRGVYIKDCNFVTIDTNIFENNYYGIYSSNSHFLDLMSSQFRYQVESGVQLTASTTITIEGCIFDENRFGLKLSFSNSLLVQKNKISNSIMHGVYSVGDSVNNSYLNNHFFNDHIYQESHNATINDNTFQKGGLILFGSTLAEYNTFNINNNTINGLPLYFSIGESHKTITDAYGQIILVDGWNITIQNQNYSQAAIGISVFESQYIQLINNICLNNTYHGIRLADSDQCELINNSCQYNGGDGISVSSGEYLLLTRNICINNSQNGLDVGMIKHSVINTNHIAANNNNGIEIFYPIFVEVVNNTCIDNSWNGIDVDAESFSDDSITISHNLFCNNSFTGIFIYELSVSYIMYNQIIKNKEFGIIIFKPAELHVHHNAFIDNEYTFDDPSQAMVEEETFKIDRQIFWYDIINGEGNYWSDLNNKSYYLISSSHLMYDPFPLLHNPFESDSYSVPGPPLNLDALVRGYAINLSWSDPLDDGGSAISRYNVYRGTTMGEYMFIGISLSTSFLDYGGTAGQTYYYVVSALNGVGEGKLSGFVIQMFPDTTLTEDSSSLTTTSLTTTSSTITSSSSTPGFTGVILAFSLLSFNIFYVKRKKF